MRVLKNAFRNVSFGVPSSGEYMRIHYSNPYIYIYVYTLIYIYIYISRFSTKVRIFQGFFELDGIHSNLLVKRPQD